MAKIISAGDIANIRNRDERNELESLGAPVDGTKTTNGFIVDHKWQKRFRLDFDVPISPEDLDQAYEQGMLRKSQLEDGRYYWGVCRNASVALWSKKNGLFYHQRWKGHWYTESIPYPGDEESFEIDEGKQVGFDVFIPWLEVEPLTHEIVEVER